MARARRVAIAVAAVAICGLNVARVSASASARARVPSARPRENAPPSLDRPEDVDVAMVEDFLTTARDEFAADYAVGGASAVDVDWIASFFLDDGRSSATARSRGNGQNANARSRRDAPRVEVDETGIDFFLAARRYAAEHAVSDPRSGRATIVRSEEANDLQWWYDFLFATQRRWIDCASNADCESIFHRGEGTFCCDAGADFWCHTHNSCVESADECVKMCERDPLRNGGAEGCGPGQFCCKRRNRASHDWNVCVDYFNDCADACIYGVGATHQCSKGERCCYDGILGYTVCVDENLSCPPPPPECPPGDEANNQDVRSNDGRFCCGGVPCPQSTDEDPWLCCPVCDHFVCHQGSVCPPQYCDSPPICLHAGTDFQRCPLNPSISAVEDGECCGNTCCNTTTSSCCLNMYDELECIPGTGSCEGPPVTSCTNRPNLDPCGPDRFCCSEQCCGADEFCCPEINGATGEITGYSCASDCQQPLCRFTGDCNNGQRFGVCGSCGNGNGDCGLACQACVGEPPNDPSSNCAYTTDNPRPPNNDQLCDGVADFLTAVSTGPKTWTCNCNNGQCGGHVGCKGQRGNCCACQSNNARGGCQCSPTT